MDTAEEADICRVCRSEGSQDKPLYHPCVCTGSIKFIHQECLLQWLKHSRKEYCELCKHRFAFTPIYSPDMPSRLPVQDICAGLVTSIGTAIRYWFHYTLVAFAWLGVVPLTASLPRRQNLLADCLQGCFVVTCTLCAFISLVPGGNIGVNAQAAADVAEAQHPADPAPDGLAPANPHEAGNHGDEAELDDEEEDDNGEEEEEEEEEEDEEDDDDEEGREEDAADVNHGGQEDLNWNALEWDRAAEELTWERALASLVKFQRPRRLLGVCYIVVKVSLLVVMEIGLFPLICGWWLDICSLEMFDATLKDREQSFDAAPGTTMFFHWLVGMVVFGSIVLLMLWLPIRIMKLLFPTFLPYNVMLYSDAPVSELSLELLLLQVVLPALLEQGHTRQWLKRLVHAWTFTAGYMLDLHSYLLGDHEDDDNQPNNNAPGRHNNNRIPGLGEGLHAAHQAILQQGGPLILLVVFMCVTLLLASLICLTLPVCAGRWVMSFWMGNAMVHELYTAASGLYICWLSIRAATVMLSWMPQGRTMIMVKVHEWTLMILKTLVVAVLLAGVIPLLLGLLFELVIVAPLRVQLHQTPLFYPWQDWALGVLHAKIIAAITLMGPQWWLKTVIEQVYANGIRNIDLNFIVRGLAAPVICVLLLSLSIRQFKRLYEHIKNDKYLVGQRLVNYERKTGRRASSSSHSTSS
ncbi:hypothetical protein FQN60_016380 [Etheostoma spectabile]|uniref:E3 ubiquitin-protein ligase MARCHF6 n=1 Tax=Etheostoma spectabile TaxID=54343 RepID=A0A5J5CW94_9PERO|nr:hypothetical protein FQN60_000524 [Etheostoma spectabile]KAA8587518.1 hypothetical protein FQN60_016380 [Etheostoma spectabile]